MKISVVVLVYNLEAYVGEAIASVIGQSRSADEIIVVDDCSTDASPQVIASFADQVRTLTMPRNRGALLAALAGVNAATGDIVCMLDGDDAWAPNKLATVEQCFQADPDLMLLSHEHVRADGLLRPTGEVDETHRNVARILRKHRDIEGRSRLFRETILMQGGYWLGSAYAFRRLTFYAERFARQIEAVDPVVVRGAYLDLVIAPFLALTSAEQHIDYTADTHFLYRQHAGASLSGNATVEGALRSLAKGRAVNYLIDHILAANGADSRYRQRRALLIEEYDYLADLYSGRTARAARRFVRLATCLWPARRIAKEGVRFLACSIGGPCAFLTRKQARAYRS